MFSKIRNLLRPAAPPEPIQDEDLGLIQFNSEERIWDVQIPGSGSSWRLRIAGAAVPDPALLAHAREIAAKSEHFRELVASFLRREASTFPGAEDEVLSLQLESLNLFWPARPNDGMLFFEGGQEGRVWRCDYINRKPDGLSFDS